MTSYLNCHILPFFIPGKLNTSADCLSRHLSPPDWHLSSSVTQKVFMRWGTPQIDLFATNLSKVVNSYVTRDAHDHLATFRDAFSRPWMFKLAWVFPPPPLLPQVLHHLNSALGKFIVVAPRWEKVFWRADLKSRACAPPNCNIESQKSPVGFNDQSSPSSGGRHNLGDLVNTGWGHQTKGWSDQDMKLLSEAWRPSTRKTYQRPWSRWLSWCSSMNIDSHNPLPQHLAQFLAHLHHSVGLALRSILLHKSVVATLSNPDNSSTLSSHPIVLKIIKGISASRLIHPSRSTWDISTLLNWIRDHRPSSQSFFEVSRHLAILFLLASGRRVHDLTLLQLDSTHFQASDDFIILWPCFGSKTDSNSFQQSGWRFTMAPAEDHLWCIPYWMRIFHTLRAKRIGSTLIPSLFISTYGRVRQASRALIAGWVSTALKAANIPFPPGSFRAAVNSSLARDNLPLDVIMMRGNWRSADTFLRYYYKPLAPDTAEMPRNNPVSIGFSPIS